MFELPSVFGLDNDLLLEGVLWLILNLDWLELLILLGSVLLLLELNSSSFCLEFLSGLIL